MNIFKVSIYSTGLLVIAAAFYFLYFQPVANLRKSEVKDFVVERGEGFREIGFALKNASLIRSENAFKFYVLLFGLAGDLKAGQYIINNASSTPEIAQMLASGPADILVTIVEGAKLPDIDGQLSNLQIIKKDELIKYPWFNFKKEFPFLEKARSLEGFLFPDTYRFYRNSLPEIVIRKFLENFQRKALPVLGTDIYKNLIVASLIEGEVPFSEDRLLVAGVLERRLKIGMPLQVDVAPETYKFYGLPLRPVNNPGLDAIYAAIHPKASEYLYYLSDPKTKKTVFSKTFEEHNKNRRIYLSD